MKNIKAKILVVEDDQALLKGLLDVLIFNGYQASGVADGAEGLSRALAEQYDLLMLDVMLPSLDGFSICRGVRKSKPTQAIIIMTAKGSEEDIVTGFKAGADDYISKPFSLRELIVRIEAILRRAGKTLGDEHVHLGGIHFDGANLQATCEGRTVELTRREMDIISYLHRNRERIVSKKELLRDVWSYADTDIETRTVDIHILKLRKKIAALAQNGPIIQTIRGEGYRLEDGP